MKTRCPGCQTAFRVTPEQLKARAGKVRCGQCHEVFNALDSLLDDVGLSTPPTPRSETPRTPVVETEALFPPPADTDSTADSIDNAQLPLDEAVEIEATLDETAAEETQNLTEADAQELGKVTGLILPRETAEIPGYSKWAEGVIAAPFSLPVEKVARWPFMIVALLLILALIAQVAFRFRSEIAIAVPSLRPVLLTLSRALNTDLSLPRHVELVSIETSDLQADPTRGNLLVLNATLRNRANYEQAYPSLELSLTDTADAAIARRVLPPAEYLSKKVRADQAFKANSELAVRLWIEAKEISAAGYRLYVFYP